MDTPPFDYAERQALLGPRDGSTFNAEKVRDGWQGGLMMGRFDHGTIIVWDEHRMQRAEVPHSEWRYKLPRDDAGNPK